MIRLHNKILLVSCLDIFHRSCAADINSMRNNIKSMFEFQLSDLSFIQSIHYKTLYRGLVTSWAVTPETSLHFTITVTGF